ncbi:MAG: DNA repair protein RadC [Syntrophales bacterium]|nr:DNA repair protein RadC [Syntrophales bacterium]
MTNNKNEDASAPDYLKHRERLKRKFSASGIAALHDYEVLELLLSYAILRKDVKPPAKLLLKQFGSLKGVMDAEETELDKVSGISAHTALLVKLVKELGSLYLKEKAAEKTQISCTAELLNYCKMALGGLKDERFYVIYLNAQNRVIDMEAIQEGIVNQAVVYPRKVLENALKRKASAIILVHNHPSGHVRPSDADIRLTKLIQDTAKILDIIVHDHIIIGENTALSFREEGIIF